MRRYEARGEAGTGGAGEAEEDAADDAAVAEKEAGVEVVWKEDKD